MPCATPRTRPDASTLATEASLDDQSKVAPTTEWPFSSNALADRRSVSPETIASAPGVTMTEPADCITSATAWPEASPAPAVIVAVPLPTAVTDPVESTTATVVSPLVHDTTASLMTRPA
ncbi:MAG: hypothetical protein OXR82_09480 [Gammaproteobacteria bacterium]|nr:hypothetical protein [Gammaproteobacteria bacterium]